MVSTKMDMVLAVISLSGGNDFMETVIPYTNPLHRDYRPNVGIREDDVLPINDELAFHPSMAPLKRFWDAGKLAVFLGIGYPHPNRSHFRSMDIWNTCEPDKLGTEGWLGRALKAMDPRAENVLTGVNFGRGLPRALVMPGVPVASVGDLETYGLMPKIEEQDQRAQALDIFSRMYSPAIGSGAVMDYIWRTGMEALKGADILRTAPGKYTSRVEYPTRVGAGARETPHTSLGQHVKNIAQVHLAELGTRVLYTTSSYNVFDTHANQKELHSLLWEDVSITAETFFDDLKDHQASENVVLFLFSEFGRRARDNGSGTDHGTGGVAFLMGDRVKGGFYGEYPSLEHGKLDEGTDLLHNLDFRSVYSTILERGLGLDPVPIVGGQYEQLDFL
jgi:uncharacterized protein (DUF1501 family)